MTRSKFEIVQDKNLEGKNVSVTYAEVTLGSIKKILDCFAKNGMNEESVFCDIGSGFGRTVFAAALLNNVKSVGIEIV